MLYHVGMADKNKQRVSIFDECMAELSPEARREIEALVKHVSDFLAAGGGEKSAKELIVQALRFLG